MTSLAHTLYKREYLLRSSFTFLRLCVEELSCRTRIDYKLRSAAPVKNTSTLKFKVQPTNAFLATLNQMFGSSSPLLTAADRAVIKSNEIVKHSSDNIVTKVIYIF